MPAGRVRGEALVTADGIEGGAIYALSGPLREAIARDGSAIVHIDLRPDIDLEAQTRQLEKPRGKQSTTTYLRKTARLLAGRSGPAPGARTRGREAHWAGYPRADLAALVKSVPLTLTSTAPIARAISSAGGVAFDTLTPDFMLIARPGIFVAGEMLDWEAPTGGYLLQACFSTGAAAGRGRRRLAGPAAGDPSAQREERLNSTRPRSILANI